MDSFYLIVLAIATVILILVLTFVGIMMKKQNGVMVYPPLANTCPDGWRVDGSFCMVPSSGNLGINPSTNAPYSQNDILNSNPAAKDGSNINFQNQTAWTAGGKTAICGQKAWANKYNIQWDGVSNYNSC